MNTLDQFTNLYKRALTLRFKLEPVTVKDGKIITLSKSPYDERLINDQKLQDTYVNIKPAIDAYHRFYIDSALKKLVSEVCVDSMGKKTAKGLLMNCILSFDDWKKIGDATTRNARTLISNFLKNSDSDAFKKMTEAKFLSDVLKNFVEQKDNVVLPYFNKEQKDLDLARSILSQSDSKLYSNCAGLLEARELLYDIDGKSVSVAYRCICSNLPMFIYDINLMEKYIEEGAIDVDYLNKDFADSLKKLSRLCGHEVTSIEQLFDVNMYPCFMVQKGIDIFNTILGNNRDRQQTKGINQTINEYNQTIRRAKKEEGKRALPSLKQLYNQILFGNDPFIPQLEEYSDVKKQVKDVIDSLKKLNAFNGCVDTNTIYSLIQSLQQYNGEGVFVSARSITNISNDLFGDWNILYNAVKRDKNGKVLQKSISLKAINDYIKELHLDEGERVSVYKYFSDCNVKDVDGKSIGLFTMLKDAYNKFCEAGILRYNALDNQQLYMVEQLMDGIMALRRFLSVFQVGTYEENADGSFYEQYSKIMDVLTDIEHHYNLIRNYFRKKPFNQDKIRLHFDKSNLLGNWPEQDKKGTYGNAYIFRVCHNGNPDYEYDYYLGIGNTSMFSGKGDDRANRVEYRKRLEAENDLSPLERYYYYQMSGTKGFTGQVFCKANGSYSKQMDREIIDILWDEISKDTNAFGKIINNGKDNYDALKLLNDITTIDTDLIETLLRQDLFRSLYQEVLEHWRKAFEQASRIGVAKDYAENGFTSHTEIKGAIDKVGNAKVTEFIPISQKELEEALSEKIDGKINKKRLFLFRITNKDLSYALKMAEGQRKSRGNENLHTMYFRALMNPDQTAFDIGAGQIFFRKASDKKRLKYNENNPTHAAGVPVKCKNLNGESRTFDYDLIKDKHYTKDTYLFHLSIFQNYNPAIQGSLNAKVNDYIRSSEKPVWVIGVDRGERNLLYAVVLDEKGNIQEQIKLDINEYKGKNAEGKDFTISTNYHDLLNNRADELKKQQKHWQAMDNITDVKKGYLSIAVHKLAKLMVEKNAILVMEDLSHGFMGTRQKNLANVYQEFENKIEAKLSYIVTDKKKQANEPGGLLNGYQLAQEDVNGTQNGFVFYVPAWMTSKIDPQTGFVNLFTLSYTNIEKARNFFKAFKSIRYSTAKNVFEFCFFYKDFAKLKVLHNVTPPDVEWTATSFGERIERKANCQYTENETIDLTERFKQAFDEAGISLESDLQSQILEKNGKDLYIRLIHLFKLMMQMRNSDENNDYIISPIENPNTGIHYDSRNYENSNEAPEDADANGAYNIARKGLMALDQIRNGQTKFNIRKEDWLSKAQTLMLNHSAND